MVTSKNVVQLLIADDLIKVAYVYSYKSCDYWKVLDQITVQLSCGKVTTIPAGFYTDMSSVPRWSWSLMSPVGDFNFAAILHDWLYDVTCDVEITREQADNELLYWSRIINKSRYSNRIDNWIRYCGVRLFGKSHWK
ncbi:DUF1353 domain-containing protein [Pinibacter soli]|uniref:DUF1353 domain-containing protein n=1 Tax=Pinibacter soli TaxID=3044211 RepID=A0ABT6R974_9BACT|nr:DUF1353 domain-containing protein [Pinibacter soli]MDI3319114.1 DUF1353 domain-containing protein [Pinibacter soli]